GTFERVERLRALTRRRRAAPSEDVERALDELLDTIAVDDAVDVIRAFNLYFQMVNLAEQLHRERRRRERALGHEEPLHGSLETLSPRARAALGRIEITLVFTAHPTEVLRRTTSEKLAEAAALLRAFDERVLTEEEAAALEAELRAQIVLLWQTNELYGTAPTVQDEVRNLIARFRESLFDEATLLFERLEAQADGEVPTFLRFGSWIGGDRDGNANVAPDAIAGAHAQARRFVLERYLEAVAALQTRLSQDAVRGGVAAGLVASVERDAAALPDVRYAIGPRQDAEPYRRKLAFVHRRLRLALSDAEHGYDGPAQLLDDLEAIEASVRTHSGDDVARPVRRLVRAVRIFGFRLYALEWRQHRDRVVRALDEAVAAIEPDAPPLSTRAESERRAWFARELVSRRPLLATDVGFSAETADLIASLRAVAELRAHRGADAVASLILAGTESASDLLALFAMARACGVLGPPIQLVPLLESPSALANGETIVCELLETPPFAAQVARLGGLWEIMLGYSDTTKVAGIVASTWALYRAQIGLVNAASAHGIELRFFHGRGGSAGRGAADARDAVAAQPPSARSGRFKVTEQGEVIGARYGLPSLARRNLELAVTSVAAAITEPPRAEEPAWHALLDRLAATARTSYEALVGDPEFLTFFAACTPVEEIGEMQISSRPGRRGARRTIDDLRAIPWSFGWAQTRAMLPGWYGFGSAVAAAAGEIAALRTMAREFPFFTILLRSVERALAVADLAIFERYARELVADAALRERFVAIIRTEFESTVRALLEVLGEDRLLAADPTLARSIELRNPYVDPISFLQLRLLRDHRARPGRDGALRDAIRISINGIAAGLRVTG
ncbi:MAG TPA: phosphoenolpyruvate carboxylase, partial [Candidatus Elarobacter sp.]